jgi:biotin operon repressor
MNLSSNEKKLLKILLNNKSFMWMVQLHTKMTYNEIIKTVKSLKRKGIYIRTVSLHSRMVEQLEYTGLKEKIRELVK